MRWGSRSQELETQLAELKKEREEQDHKVKAYQLQTSHAEAQKVALHVSVQLADTDWHQANVEAEMAAFKSENAIELQKLHV